MSYSYPPSGYPPGQPGHYRPLPDHPQGTMILVLGIVGFFVGVTGIIAWVLGSKALKEIKTSGVHYANEQSISIGRILGIITTILFILGLVLFTVYIIVIWLLIVNGTFPQ